MELKCGKNRQTENQRKYQEHVETHGGKYVVIRSIDEFIECVKGYLC